MRRLAASVLLASLGCAAAVNQARAFDVPPADIEFIGSATLPATPYEDTEVGGLSAIAFDSETGLFYALSDDPGSRSPSRFYSLSVDLSSGRLSEDGVHIEGVTLLTDRQGRHFAKGVIDGEGLALRPDRTLLVSSEGFVRGGVPPSIRVVGLDGRERHEFHLPKRWLPREGDPSWGARHNNAFESLTLGPDGSFFTSTENALLQDGPDTDVDRTSRVRIVRMDAGSGATLGEWVYRTDTVIEPPSVPDAFRTNGLVDLLALDGTSLLALERSFTLGKGNSIRLFAVSLDGADDVRSIASIEGRDDIVEVSKRLLVDLGDLDVALDNVEGLTLGPRLEDGRHSLLLISDNNFSSLQVTQVLAFALDSTEPRLGEVQGGGHRSPYEGRFLSRLEGIVTAKDLDGRRRGFWLQASTPDANPHTSEGIYVRVAADRDVPDPGDRARVGGRLVESQFSGQLSVTELHAYHVEVLESGTPLPEAVEIVDIPRIVDDDGMATFDPIEDALDFFESLEGMRVRVGGGVVVGPTSRFGTLTLLPEGAAAGSRTDRGGLRLTADGPDPARLEIDGSLVGGLPDVAVGDFVEAPIEGVLDYAFGRFRVMATETITPTKRDLPGDCCETIVMDRLKVATFNVENLDALDAEEKFVGIARQIAAPHSDLVALQEIQDDSGADDDGTVTAAATLHRLVEAIVSVGGPRYRFVQLDPENNTDGGAPGGNIRVAFLYNPRFLSLAEDGGLLGSANPVRLFESDPAFLEDEATGFDATRKPLAAVFEIGGRRLTAINVHLKSKRGDDPIFGDRQPPERATERQRTAQARALAEVVRSRLARDPDAWIVVLGDFNDHGFRRPLKALGEASLVNVIERVDAGKRYTYNYAGTSQVLDHILLSPALAAADPIVEIRHENADFPHARRASDHDPVTVSLQLRQAASLTELESDAPE